MKKTAKAIVIAGNGTNCEREVAFACRLAGAQTDIVHIADLLAGTVQLSDYHFLNLAGGFLDGDDLGSAKAGANRLMYAQVAEGQASLAEQLKNFITQGCLVMGVCNGFQLMVKMGLLPGLGSNFEQNCTLTFNEKGRFEDRWSWLKVDEHSPCVYTQGLDHLYLPVRHGEGKFVARSGAVIDELERKHLCVLKYADPALQVTMDYPDNPNGSQQSIAGICDQSGRLFGLMPHPEAFVHRTQHPRWTREDLPEEGMGLKLYRNAVKFIVDQLL